ncbi:MULTISPECIES: MFS transporter [unclassified Jeotgalibaca]|uniref:MFS transporter n=1 Tax=unclassified Jeotgalibaca TaxID=2621505 RepID=UPI003FD2C2D7
MSAITKAQENIKIDSSKEKLGVVEKVSYGLGDLGNGLMFQMAQLYLLKFYTDVLGISAYWGGMIFLLTKIIDAVTDTLIGTYVDSRKVGPKGKFRPFILYGTGFLAASTVLAFFAPDLNEGAKVVFAFATYNLMSVAYTVVNIPYGSLSSVMTVNSEERTSLAVFRNLGGTGASLLAGIVVLPLVNLFDTPTVGYPAAVAIIALFGVAFHLVCYRNTKERYVSTKAREKGDGIKAVKNLLTNKEFLVLAAYTILTIGAMFLKMGIQLYYFQYVLGNQNLVALVSTLSIVALVPSIFLSTTLVRKFGKKQLSIFGMFFFGVFELVNFFFAGDNVTFFLIVNVLSYTCLSFANTVSFAFAADLIDYSQWKHGMRTEGIIYSGYSFVRKIAQAVAGFVPGIALTMIGYVANQAQTADTISGMQFTYFLIPAIASFIGVILFQFGYKLTDQKHAEITAELRARNEI